MSGFLYLLSWELKKVGKFPIPELLLIVVGLQVGMGMFNISNSTSSGAFPTGILLIMGVISEYESFIEIQLGNTISGLFISTSLFVAVLVALTFSNEIENGMFKTALSRPVKRRSLFLTKFISVMLVINAISCIFVLLSLLLLDPSTWAQFLSAWKGWGLALILLVISSFFVASLGVFASMLSKSVAITSLVTIGMVVIVDTISGKLVFLPGESLRRIIVYAGSGEGLSHIEAILAAGLMPMAGILLFIVSYYLFTRRLDIN
ncbi:MAG TPA: hypothetical protein PLC12_03595 [Candidatus Methanofastidiosa archaeon]|nr:hypothetical protein [Candidatus Methanofastidiosa archaeon]